MVKRGGSIPFAETMLGANNGGIALSANVFLGALVDFVLLEGDKGRDGLQTAVIGA